MVDDDRSQEDRDHVPHQLVGVLLPRRSHGPRRPDGACPAGPPVHDRHPVQRAVHDARHDHDLPVRDPDPGGLRQLRCAAPDRRAGHGLPADQRAVAVDAPARRPPAPARLRDRRDGGRGLDRLSPAVGGPAARGGRDRPGPVDRRHRPDRDELDPGRDQLPGHDLQDAGARDDPVPNADPRLDRPDRPRSWS